MSRHKDRKPQPSPAQGMPRVEYLFADEFRYSVRGDGTTLMAFAVNGEWQTGIAIPTHLAVEFQQKLVETLATVIRANAPKEESKDGN